MKGLKALCKKYENISKEWKLTKLDTDISPIQLSTDVKYEISYDNKKMGRDEKLCVVYGRVSSGKSMLINAILGRQILPSGGGSTTDSFVEIRKSDDNTDYVIYPDSSNREDIATINCVDYVDGSLPTGSIVQLFLSGTDCAILSDNVVIIDTPGMDTYEYTDKTIHDLCKEADLLVLVVNSIDDISETDKNFLLKHKTIFSKFELLIVFNQWDAREDCIKESLQNKYSRSAYNYLCDDLGVTNFNKDERIFFLSALERLGIPNEVESIGWEKLYRSFDGFIKIFNKHKCGSSDSRKLVAKNHTFEIFTRTIELMRDHRNILLDRITDKVTVTLSRLIDMNEIINKAVENLFEKHYEDKFNLGLKAIKTNLAELEEAKQLRYEFIFEQMTVMFESLKIIINDLVKKSDAADKAFTIWTIEKLYFNYYVNADNHIDIIKSCQVYTNFVKKVNEILRDSYKRFLENIRNVISLSMSETENEFNNIKKKVDEFKDKWELLYMQEKDLSQKLISNSHNVLVRLENVCKQYENIQKEWPETKLEGTISPIKLSTDAQYEISFNNEKLKREEMTCVVYGRVSSGKSLFINSILGRTILPNGGGSTTDSFVEIRKSDDNTDYVIYPDSSERQDIATINRVDVFEESLPSGSKVQLFLSGIDCAILPDNVVIIDTPGIDRNEYTDTTIHDLCKEADLLVLVVNSVNDISETDKNFLLKHKTLFSKFELLIVFNHWDEIEDSRKKRLHDKYKSSACNYLCEDLGITNFIKDERIFFLSALERLRIPNKGMILSIIHYFLIGKSIGWEELNRSFDCFTKIFNNHICRLLDIRKLAAKDHNFDIYTRTIELMRDHRNMLLARITDKVTVTLSRLIDMNEIINNAVENLFNQDCEDKFNLGLEPIKTNVEEFEEAKQLRYEFIFEQMTVMFESLKIIINDLVKKSVAADKALIIWTIEKLYYNYYVNADNHIDIIKSCQVYMTFKTKVKEILRDSYKRFSENIRNVISLSMSEIENEFNNIKKEVDELKDKWELFHMHSKDLSQRLISNSHNALVRLENVCQQYEDIQKEWPETKLEGTISPIKLSTDLQYEIAANNEKLKRKEMKCVVYGEFSSGKSLFINSILGRPILPSDLGSTTNIIVEIRKSDDNTDYVIYPDSSKRQCLDTINRVDDIRESLPSGSKVQLFLSGIDCAILPDDVVIIDTPGINKNDYTDNTIHDLCKEADLLVLVVNSVNDISETDKKFLLKHKTIFSEFELLIVFYHWDKIEDSRKERLKDKYKRSAYNYLCQDLGVTNFNEDKRIFFLSALERLKKPNEVKSIGCEERDPSFDYFIEIFSKYSSISYDERILAVMKKSLKIIIEGFQIIKKLKDNLIPRFIEKVEKALNKLPDMNEIINKMVTRLFDQSYDIFFNRGLNTLRLHASDLENVVIIMDTFISEQVVVLKESLKIVINELLSKFDEKDKDFITNIIERLYFQYFINEDIVIEIIEKADLYPVFNEISTTIKRHRIFAIAGFGFAGSALLVPAAVAVGIVFPVIDAIAIPVAVVTFSGAGSVGAAVTANISLMRQNLERGLFKPRYADHESHVLYLWNSLNIMFTNSYNRFEESIPKIISASLANSEKDFNNLENEVKKFKEKWEQFIYISANNNKTPH